MTDAKPEDKLKYLPSIQPLPSSQLQHPGRGAGRGKMGGRRHQKSTLRSGHSSDRKQHPPILKAKLVTRRRFLGAWARSRAQGADQVSVRFISRQGRASSGLNLASAQNDTASRQAPRRSSKANRQKLPHTHTQQSLENGDWPSGCFPHQVFSGHFQELPLTSRPPHASHPAFEKQARSPHAKTQNPKVDKARDPSVV